MLEVLGCGLRAHGPGQGLPPKGSVLFKHALRNAALPILTVAGLQFGGLISGALLVETVFNWPGMGRARLRKRSCGETIRPCMGVLFFASAMVVVANILTDICATAWADPRLRTEPLSDVSDHNDTVRGHRRKPTAREAWRMFRRNKPALVGMAFILSQ